MLDTLTFFQEKRKMCDAIKCGNKCPIFLKWIDGDYIGCCDYCEDHPLEILRVVEKWANEEDPTFTVNWYEVPAGTKILVKDHLEDEWNVRTFIKYDEKYDEHRPYICLGDISNCAVAWAYAALIEEEK